MQGGGHRAGEALSQNERPDKRSIYKQAALASAPYTIESCSEAQEAGDKIIETLKDGLQSRIFDNRMHNVESDSEAYAAAIDIIRYKHVKV